MGVGDILYVHLGWAWRYKREDRRGRKRDERKRREVSECKTSFNNCLSLNAFTQK